MNQLILIQLPAKNMDFTDIYVFAMHFLGPVMLRSVLFGTKISFC